MHLVFIFCDGIYCELVSLRFSWVFLPRENASSSGRVREASLPDEVCAPSASLENAGDPRSFEQKDVEETEHQTPPTTMASSSLKSVNPNAEIMSKAAALFMNINAAKGLQDVMKSNLGPKGTIKMLVGGAGGARA